MKNIIDNFEEVLGSIFIAAMVTISFINVITRYFLHFSFAFTEELTLYMFVWATMLGVSIAFKHASNMNVSLLYDRFPKAFRKYIYIFTMLISVAFFVTLAYWGYIEVRDEFQMNVMTEAMQLPVFWFTAAMPLISAVTIVRIFVRLYTDIKNKNY